MGVRDIRTGFLWGKSERRRVMWRNVHTWKDDIKINLKDRLWDIVDWL